MDDSVGGSISHSSVGTAPITLKHVFGLKTDVRNNLLYLDENSIMYPAGHNVAIYRIEQRDQTFIYSATHPFVSEGVTALAVSPNKKLIAVAERSVDRAVVTLYEAATLKRRRVLTCAELGSREVVSVAFSSDGKNVLTQGGAPDFTLVLWSIDKIAKVVCSTKLLSSVYRADLCPSDPNVVCCSGDGLLRFFRVQEGSFRLIPLLLRREPQNYLCHCWLDNDKVVVSTDSGDLMLIDSFELKGLLHHPRSGEEAHSINAIVAFAKGFICGGGGGVLRIFERFEDSRELYKCSKVFRLNSPRPCTLITLAMSPSEDTLISATDTHQIYTFSLSSVDMLKEEHVTFEHLSAGFHGPGEDGSARISGLDVCAWKPVVITCGVDKSVRLWNYRDKTLELVKFFPREAHSVALHPSGLYCVLGFPESLKLASIFVNDIRPFFEIPIKSCHEVRFSHGGEYVCGANNALVQVHSTYTGETIALLKGHTAKVKSIAWKTGDRRLVTCSVDGSVILWNVLKGVKEAEHNLSRVSYSCAVCPSDLTHVYVAASDNCIRQLELPSMNLKHTITLDGCQVSALALTFGERLLVVGTGDADKPGRVRARVLSNADNEYSESFVDVVCHERGVSRLKLSVDGSLLFSAGADGALCIFEVSPDLDARPKGLKDHGMVEGQFAEEILVTKADLDEQAKVMTKLRNKVDELSLNNEYQLRLKDLTYKDKIKDITDSFQEDLRGAVGKLEQVVEEKKAMELEFDDSLRDLEDKHDKDFKDLEEQYSAKMAAEVQRYQELFQEKEGMNRRWDEENQVLIEAHTDYLKHITEEYDRKVGEEQKHQKELEDLKTQIRSQFDHMQQLIEDDAEMEVENLTESYETKLKQEREATLRLKFENGIKKRTFTSLTKDVEDQSEMVKGLKDKQKGCMETIRVLEKDIQGHKKEIREREETIADKDRRISDLKKRNQELEKFKFVLDYKIKELRRQIEPREQEIKCMRTQIEEMDVELEQYHKSNSALELMIQELRLKMEGLHKEAQGQENELARGQAYMNYFRHDLQDSVKSADDYKTLKTKVVQLYKSYVSKDNLGPAGSGGGETRETQQGYNRQREHLERNVEQLKNKITKDLRLFQSDHQQLVNDNVLLTEEINALRREEKKLTLQHLQLDRAAVMFLNPKARMTFLATGEMAGAGRSGGLNRSTKRNTGMLGLSGGMGDPSPPGSAPGTAGSINGATRAEVTARAVATRELEMQKQQIEQLEAQIRRLQDVLDVPTAERIKQLA